MRNVRLSEDEQDTVAMLLLAEFALEERWEKRFAETQSHLSALAQEALREAGDRGLLKMCKHDE